MEDFVKKAQAVHGDRYDYSKVKYVSSRKKVTIICKVHGDFLQTPEKHLMGRGCYKCNFGESIKRSNSEDFIKKAIVIHGDRYDYSKVEYRSCHEKVRIICREHGEFEQRPSSHLQGMGCKRCYSDPTTEDFIRKAIAVHGDRYDYSKVEYRSCHEKVRIICREHGEFEQSPNHHLSGSGCKECVKKPNTEDFIRKAIAVHGDRYDYSRAEYAGLKGKVVVVCKEHGEFEQLAGVHLQGSGCPSCSKWRGSDQTAFIRKARKIHGDLYDYSKVDYGGQLKKVVIICKEHGEFLQSPKYHINSRQGCPKCGGASRLTLGEFISKASAKHNGKYGYELVDYVNNSTKVRIICRDHGEFLQTPMNHLAGNGCPLCSQSATSRGEMELFEYVKSLYPSAESRRKFKSDSSNFELDVWVPERNIGIEYNGEYWHSEEFLGRMYHRNKLLKCGEAGIRLVQIWEREWRQNRIGVEGFITRLLAGTQKTLYARSLRVGVVPISVEKEFLEKNHLQGYYQSSFSFGLYDDMSLVQMMSVIKRGGGDFEISRLASTTGCSIVGGGGEAV